MSLSCLSFALMAFLVPAARAAFAWPAGDAGLFIAIAVPIDLPHYHVFVSYNFEAHYRLPRSWWEEPHYLINGTHGDRNGTDYDEYDYYGGGGYGDYYFGDDDHVDNDDLYDYDEPGSRPGHNHGHKHGAIPTPKPSRTKDKKKDKKKEKTHGVLKPPKKKNKPKPSSSSGPTLPQPEQEESPPDSHDEKGEDYKDFFEDFPIDSRKASAKAKQRTTRSLLTRRYFYEILKRKFEEHGFGPGDHCLLRLICETNSSWLGQVNGVLGNLMHIMFSPSTSQYEALPEHYYTAELHGQRDQCAPYQSKCERSVLDIVTRPLVDYIEQLQAGKQ